MKNVICRTYLLYQPDTHNYSLGWRDAARASRIVGLYIPFGVSVGCR
jgi:hypothetical protein